jgi:hypothetical protein
VFHPATPSETAASSPLGPSYLLVPLPNDDDSLLGRVLLDVPENGRSLDEVSRPNECADKLTAKKEGPLASTFEDGQELAAGGKASAALGAFGFEGDAQTATHFYYKLDVNKRVAQTDTTDYVACCKDKGTCGYGFVSALIYGDGEYATVAETNGEANLRIPLAGGAGGFLKAKVLHKRNVHGYVAALVTITDQAKSKSISVLGDASALGITLTEENLPDQIRARFNLDRIQVSDVHWTHMTEDRVDNVVDSWAFSDGRGSISEAEFVRRYSAIVGQDDKLDAAPEHPWPWLVTGIAGAATGLGLTVGGAVAAAKPGAGNGPLAPIFLGLLTFGGGMTVTIVTLNHWGPDPLAHNMSELDARLYASRYNRTLLRKTIQETRERMQQLSGKNDPPPLRVMPIISPGFTGIVGQF